MKVLMIDNYAAPYRVDLYNMIAKEFDFTVVYGVKNDRSRDSKYVNDNIQYKTIWLNGIRIGNNSSLSFKIKKIIKEGKYDVIMFGGYDTPTAMIAMRYLKKKKIPFTLNADGGFVKEVEPKWKRWIKKYFISMASAWLTSGPYTSKYLVYYGADKDNIYHFPFAFNYSHERCLPTQEEKQSLKAELGITEKKNILFIGRMQAFKRVDLLLKAFAKVQGDVGLYILGVDKLPDEYQQIIDELKIKNVHCEGFKSGQELKNYYKASDIFVLPSSHEVWGLVINEALTNSCPIITSDTCISGIELIQHNKNGIIFETDNEAELVRAMQNLLDNDELREEIAKNEYESVKDFNIENNAKKHIEIIKDFYKKFIAK